MRCCKNEPKGIVYLGRGWLLVLKGAREKKKRNGNITCNHNCEGFG